MNALGQHFLSSHSLGQTLVSPHEPTVAEEIDRLVSTPVTADDVPRVTPEELEARERPNVTQELQANQSALGAVKTL